MNSAPPVIYIHPSRITFFGAGLELAAHENLVATLVIGCEDTFDLTMYEEGRATGPTPERIALLPPSQRHQLHTRGEMIFIYLDPLSDDHSKLSSLDLVKTYELLHSSGALSSRSPRLLHEALGLEDRAAPAAALERALRTLERDPDAYTDVGALAKQVRLSASRLQHVFSARVGLPFRRYRLWRRMTAAARILAAGGTLTRAAHGAGFASSAHLSAAFKSMFGLTPSALLALNVTLIVATPHPDSG
jgi:AraC-like DNA-binding protein